MEIYKTCAEVSIRLAGSLVIMTNASNVAIHGGVNSGSNYVKLGLLCCTVKLKITFIHVLLRVP